MPPVYHENRIIQQRRKRAGGTRQTIVALEQGKYVPSIELAFRLTRVFGAAVEDVFQYMD